MTISKQPPLRALPRGRTLPASRDVHVQSPRAPRWTAGDTNSRPRPEYVIENSTATPDEVLAAADLDESLREQVEHYLAVTRYTMFKDDEGLDADGLR